MYQDVLLPLLLTLIATAGGWSVWRHRSQLRAQREARATATRSSRRPLPVSVEIILSASLLAAFSGVVLFSLRALGNAGHLKDWLQLHVLPAEAAGQETYRAVAGWTLGTGVVGVIAVVVTLLILERGDGTRRVNSPGRTRS
jgi:hypothetical protein